MVDSLTAKDKFFLGTTAASLLVAACADRATALTTEVPNSASPIQLATENQANLPTQVKDLLAAMRKANKDCNPQVFLVNDGITAEDTGLCVWDIDGKETTTLAFRIDRDNQKPVALNLPLTGEEVDGGVMFSYGPPIQDAGAAVNSDVPNRTNLLLVKDNGDFEFYTLGGRTIPVLRGLQPNALQKLIDSFKVQVAEAAELPTPTQTEPSVVATPTAPSSPTPTERAAFATQIPSATLEAATAAPAATRIINATPTVGATSAPTSVDKLSPEYLKSELEKNTADWLSGAMVITDGQRFTEVFTGKPDRLGLVGSKTPNPAVDAFAETHGVLLGLEIVNGSVVIAMGYQDVLKQPYFVMEDLGDGNIFDTVILHQVGDGSTGPESAPDRNMERWSGQKLVSGLESLIGDVIRTDSYISFAGIDQGKANQDLKDLFKSHFAQGLAVFIFMNRAYSSDEAGTPYNKLDLPYGVNTTSVDPSKLPFAYELSLRLSDKQSNSTN